MNRFGTREDVSVSGTVYEYSGPLKGKLGSIFGKPPRTSNGLMRTSFAPKRTDSGENASVENYDSTGVWKQRFVDFSRDEDGFSLKIYRAKPDPEAMARWASPDDVAQAGLPASESFPVGGSSPAYDASTSGSPKSQRPNSTTATSGGRRATFTQQMRSMSKVHNNTLADDPMKQHMFENQLFKQQIDKKEAVVRHQFRLTEKPITVRNVQLRSKFTDEEDAEYLPPSSEANHKKHQPVAFFILRKKSNFQAIHHVEEHQFVVQIEIEGGLIEIVGRTDEHTEKWYHRLQAVSRIHTAFCKLQRILLSRALNPVLPGRDEFPIARILQNPDTPSLTPSSPSFSVDEVNDDNNESAVTVMTQMLLCKMSLSYSRKGFDVTFVGRAVSGRTMTWRIALDEQPVANTVDQYTEVKGVLLSNVDLERISLAVNPDDERFLAGRPLETLRILRGGVASERTGQGTSSLYYLSKWVNFIAAFAKLYLASHPGDSDRWGGQEASGIYPSAEGIIEEASGADFSGSENMSPTVRLMHDSQRSTAVGSPRSEASLGGMGGMAMGGSLPMDSPRDLIDDASMGGGSPRAATPTSPLTSTPSRGQQATNAHSRSNSGHLPPKRRKETIARNTTVGSASSPNQPPLVGISSSKQSSTSSTPRHVAGGHTDLPLPGIHISNSAESSIHDADRLMGGDSDVFRAPNAPTAHPSQTSSPHRAGGRGDHNQKGGGRSPSNPAVVPPQAQVRPSGTRAAADAIANTTFGEFVSEGDQTDTTTSQATSPAISHHGGAGGKAGPPHSQSPRDGNRGLPPVPQHSQQRRATSPRHNQHRSSGSSSPSHRHQSPRVASHPRILSSDSEDEDRSFSGSGSSSPSGLASGFSINSSLESTPRRHNNPKMVVPRMEHQAVPRGEPVRKYPHIASVYAHPHQPLLFTPTVHVPHSELNSTLSHHHLIDRAVTPAASNKPVVAEGKHKKKLRSRFLRDEQTLVESMVPFFSSGNHEAAMISVLSFRSAYPPVIDLIATPQPTPSSSPPSMAPAQQHHYHNSQPSGLPTPIYRSHTPNSRRDDASSYF